APMTGLNAAADAGQGTLDARMADCEKASLQAETDLAKARARQAAEQAEERVARAALDAARAALGRAEAEQQRLQSLIAELGQEAPLVERRRAARAQREAAEVAIAKASDDSGATE